MDGSARCGARGRPGDRRGDRRAPRPRPVVADSWDRSSRVGLDPERVLAPVPLDAADVRALRAASPLRLVLPAVRRLLLEQPLGVPVLVALSDERGHLLWVEGDRRLRVAAEGMRFVEGARWSEDAAGTNAPGTALLLDRPVRVSRGEHFASAVARWSCSAAPLHDPRTGRLLGVLDVTGGDELGGPRALDLVRAVARVAEAELGALALPRPVGPVPAPAPLRLEVLGRPAARLHPAAGALGPRHGELLLLLLARPEGCSAAELALALAEEDLAPVTVRAELTRLRAVLERLTAGALGVEARPYRLVAGADQGAGAGADPGAGLECDALAVRRALAEGRTADALALHAGPVLPRSTAPGVVELREELQLGLRTAVLAAGEAELLLRFGRTAAGRQDAQVWEALLAAGAGPARGEALARLEGLRG